MIATVTAALLIAMTPLQSDKDRPVVVLGNSGDTGFIHPLDTAERAGDLWRGELVSVMSLAEEFSIIRTDTTFEIDCSQRRIRIVAAQSYGHDGVATKAMLDDEAMAWEAVDLDGWPPIAALYSIGCQNVDLKSSTITMAQAEERVRGRISDY